MKISEDLSLSSAQTTLRSFKKWNVSVECFLSVKRIRSHRQYHWFKSKFCRAHMEAEQESKASKWLSYCFNTSAPPLSVPPYPTSHTISHPSLRPGSCGSLRSFCWVLLSVAASLRSHASQVKELRFLCAADFQTLMLTFYWPRLRGACYYWSE